MRDVNMDELDRASMYEQLLLSAAISTACTLANEPIEESKICFNCGETTLDGSRWCSAECREDGELRRKNSGRVI